ncbi:NADPH-dependent FMN reductase [Actinoplanes sp. NPDC051494]|uniref:NADPH-dependent FMN reductase n=1 Tax=Actinoplanes sp. NPDC051494 TaxID=3363907 RepID=UPI0037B769B2
MVQIAIIVGSTRPGRGGRIVAEWVAAQAAQEQPGAGFDIVDLADFAPPMLDEPQPALFGRYRNAHTVRWAETVARFDGFVFVTPEYNYSIPAALNNALDFLHLRLILAELHQDFTFSEATEPGEFGPGPHQHQALAAMLDEVVVRSRALTQVRVGACA